MPRARSKAAVPAKFKRDMAAERTLSGPYANIVLRRAPRLRADKLDFTVEVRPIGTEGLHDHIVARFKLPGDAKMYAAVIAKRSGAKIIDHT